MSWGIIWPSGMAEPDHISFKPNHLSLMSYYFQTGGIPIIDTDGKYYYLYDYSRLVLPPLNENSLNENAGLGPRAFDQGVKYGTRWYVSDGVSLHKFEVFDGRSSIDWNKDGALQSRVKEDLNILFPYVFLGNTVVERPYTILKGGYNEWTHLNFRGGSIGKSGLSSQKLLPESTAQLHCLNSRQEQSMQMQSAPSVERVTFADLKRKRAAADKQ